MAQNMVFIGDGGVGKTSIINRVLGLGFNESYSPTSGIQAGLHGFIDSSGQEKFGIDWTAIAHDVDCVAIVFDLTSRLSFRNLRFWIDLAHREFPTSRIRILGNKSDCTKKVQQQEIQSFCGRLGCDYNEVSARANIIDLFAPS
tara:strand:- start:137 stop:568 length:432 start_codon:yes stop_codon:yes gene_type:complete